jgi:hypothetical protein
MGLLLLHVCCIMHHELVQINGAWRGRPPLRPRLVIPSLEHVAVIVG